jgi:hypothetical protein
MFRSCEVGHIVRSSGANLLQFALMEEQFASYNLDISWTEFGDQRESDLDDFLATDNIHGERRTKLVSLWKRHPDRQQGKSMIICYKSIACTLYSVISLSSIIWYITCLILLLGCVFSGRWLSEPIRAH